MPGAIAPEPERAVNQTPYNDFDLSRSRVGLV